jgi:hypothetical protein
MAIATGLVSAKSVADAFGQRRVRNRVFVAGPKSEQEAFFLARRWLISSFAAAERKSVSPSAAFGDRRGRQAGFVSGMPRVDRRRVLEPRGVVAMADGHRVVGEADQE